MSTHTAQVAMNPKNTVFDAKRLIGRHYHDPTVQDDMKHWPFKVIRGPEDKPLVQGGWGGGMADCGVCSAHECALTKWHLRCAGASRLDGIE